MWPDGFELVMEDMKMKSDGAGTNNRSGQSPQLVRSANPDFAGQTGNGRKRLLADYEVRRGDLFPAGRIGLYRRAR